MSKSKRHPTAVARSEKKNKRSNNKRIRAKERQIFDELKSCGADEWDLIEDIANKLAQDTEIRFFDEEEYA